jgi:hypothetical protein
MKIFEIESRSNFNPLLVEFWKTRTPEQLQHYFKVDNCYDASTDFVEFLDTKRLGGYADIIDTGYIDAKKHKGWIKVDVPLFDEDSLTDKEIAEMRKLGLNSTNPADIKQYATEKDIVEELTWIPHSWVELKGKILDPSGFYIDGKSGQFDRLIKDKNNLASRYHYFP